MDRYDTDRLILSRCVALLRSIFEAIKQSVVETDPASVREFRQRIGQHIDLLHLTEALTDEAADAKFSGTFSNDMRHYADSANAYIRKIRQELETTAQALDSILQQTQGSRSEQRLDEEVERLRSAVQEKDPESLKTRVSRSVEGISACVEQIRREKNVVIAQLQDEIRLLHQTIDNSRRAAETDPVTGVLKREEAVKAIRRDLAAGRHVGVVRISIANFAGLTMTHGAALMERVVTGMCKRLAEIVPGQAILALWQKEAVSVVLPAALVGTISPDPVVVCTGHYVCMDDGSPRTIYVEAVAASLCSKPGEDADEFLAKLDRMKR